MADTNEPVLELSTLVERPKISIDGKRYEIASPGDQVDLAELRTVAPCDDTVALDEKRGGGKPFACEALSVGPEALATAISVHHRLP